jgi:hypothetical protein
LPLKKTIITSLTLLLLFLSLSSVFKKDQQIELSAPKEDTRYEELLRKNQTALAAELAKAGQFGLYRFLQEQGPVVIDIQCTDYRDIAFMDVQAHAFFGKSGDYYLQKMGEMRANARKYNLAVYNQPNFPFRNKCSIKGP